MISIKKIAVVASFLAISVVLAGCSLYKTNNTENQPAGQSNTTSSETSQAADSVTITFTGSGVEGSMQKVKSGGTITWKNTGTAKVQVGSASHPQHTDNQEITGNKFVLEVIPGGEETVTVSKVGTWGFHDHLNLKVNGKVVVE